MSLSKKPLGAFLAALFLCQQVAFATPLDMARALDARRFASAKNNSAEKAKLDASSFERLEKFNRKTNSSWHIRMNGATKAPRSLVGGKSLKVGSGEKGALKFIKSNKEFLGVNEKDLRLIKKPLKSDIGTHYYFRQYYKNLPVENAYVKVNADAGGALLNYQSTYIPNLDLSVKESVSASAAAAAAAQDADGKALSSAEKVIYVHPSNSEPRLAWKVLVQGGEKAPAKWDYYVDAQNGEILNRISKIFYANRVSNTSQFSININPVYPKAAVASTQTLPLSDMYVYSFDASKNPQAPKTTDADGKATVNGRVWATLDGPYFTVTNEAAVTKYYVEKGDLDTFDVDSWTTFAKGADYKTYSACEDASEYPVFSYPLIEHFNLGKMNTSGDIEDKKFLFIEKTLPSPVKAGAYIGRFNSINGPLVSNYDSAQSLSFSFYPDGFVAGSESYTINNLRKLCVPSAPAEYESAPAVLEVSMGSDLIQSPEAVAFYNLNAMRTYFKSVAGTAFVNELLSGHMPVMVNASGARYAAHDDGMQNAFYDLDADTILIGQGRYDVSQGRYINLALESAIVRHEYTHAVMNKIWPITYFDEGAAISEAVADYFALSSIKNASGVPYTSVIGGYVAGVSGEGMARNLLGTDIYTPEKWMTNGAPMGQHENSKFLSQALWDLRTSASASVSSNADKLVWYSLMFFPDSLLEFRDAMVAAAKVVGGTSLVSAVESAFNAHGLNYDTVITANGDIYEPNNGPMAAADLDIVSIKNKELSAAINPASDIDYYSLSLPEGQFKAVLNLPQVQEDTYMPLGMFLLNADMQTAVDLVRPSDVADDQQGYTGITTRNKTITLSYDAPALLNGNSGRYILGVYKLSNGYYPNTVDSSTGAYKLNFAFAEGSNIKLSSKQVENFNDGTIIEWEARTDSVGILSFDPDSFGAAFEALGLDAWPPDKYDVFHSVRLLDAEMNPITGASTADNNYLQLAETPHLFVDGKLTGKVKLNNNFASFAEANGLNMVYLQVFGKLRSYKANKDVGNTEYRDDYGVVSLGVSNPIIKPSAPGVDVFVKDSVFNPMKGGKAKIEVNPKADGKIKVQLFTVDGLLVKTLKEGDVQKDNIEYIEWEGQNTAGNVVASGVYLLRIDGAGVDRKVKKIVVVK